MRIRTLLLAGSLLPFAAGPSFALDANSGPILLAQADQACPEGQECPPQGEQRRRASDQQQEPQADQTRQQQRQQRQQERQQQRQQRQQQQEQEQPAAEPEAPAAEQPAGQTRQQRQQRQRQQRQQQQEQEQPAAEQEAPAAEESAGQTRQQQRQQRQQRQQQQRRDQQQEPAAETPGAEAPAEEPAAEAPAEGEPEAGQGDRRQRAQERARRQQERRQRRQRQQEQQQDQAGEPPRDEDPTGEEPTGEQAGEQPRDEDSTVEQQLEAQGDREEADQVRELRQRLRRERRQAGIEERHDRRERAQGDQAYRERPRDRDEEGRIVERRGDRIIIDLGGGQLIVRRDTPDEGERLLYGADDVRVERLPNGRVATTVFRRNGSRIVTVRDDYGNIVRRYRVTPNDREVILIDNRFYYDDRPRPPILYDDLPPPVIGIPQNQYIVDLGQASDQDIQGALLAPPVQPVEQQYTLDEVTQNERLRSYVPRIDLDSITFAFGSSTIDSGQMDALYGLGEAMENVVAENPEEVYLIEGHTDAVGSDEDNLLLSDERAEAVAVALSQNFEIPPENLVTEGYGEQYLKVDTEAEERQNRRVTVRRITPLLSAENAQ